MTALDNKLILSNITEIKPQKPLMKKLAITPKKINLCKKYFYIDNTKALNLKQLNNGKFLKLMEDNNNNKEKGDILEQVDYVMTQFEQKKMELNKKKIDCIKSMILNNKNIPERWIMKSNYKNLLNEAMEDEIVLNYAILCQDKYKKTAGVEQTDEERYLNYKQNLSPEKKFISYINPYSRNYIDTPIKKKLMKNYCLSIKRNNRNTLKNNNFYNNSLNLYQNKNNLIKKINYDKSKNKDKSSNSSEDMIKDKNKLPLIYRKGKIDNDENNNLNAKYNMNETNEELMVTSLYYSGLNNKNNKDQENNNNYNQKKNIKLPELPLI